MEYKSIEAIGTSFDVETGIISGYPSVFGVVDDGDWSGMKDIVMPGAFRKTIQENSHRILVCYGHNPVSQLPIGKPVELSEHPRDMLPEAILGRFPQATGGLFSRAKISDTTLGRDVGILVNDGVLKELSIGYNAIKTQMTESDSQNPIRVIREIKLWEWSIVPWGQNPAALITGAKGAIGFAHRPLADRDVSWDGPAEVARAETNADLRAIHAWVDSDVEPDDDGNLPKSAFKLPHHRGSSPYQTVWRGVAAAMAALLGARGGVNIPEGDRRGVYTHLSRHYHEFDEEPPDFKDYHSLGFNDEAIEVMCGVWLETNPIETIDHAILVLQKAREVYVPRVSSDMLVARLITLQTELNMLEAL